MPPAAGAGSGGGGAEGAGGFIAFSGPDLLDLLKSVRMTLVKKEQPDPAFTGGGGGGDHRSRGGAEKKKKLVGRYFFQNVDPRAESAPLRSRCGLDVEFRTERFCTWDKVEGRWKDKGKQQRYVDMLKQEGWAVVGDRARKTVPPGQW